MPKKVYKKLSQEQIERGIIFTSTLSRYTTEQPGDNTHVVYGDRDNKWEQIARLKDDKFFRNNPSFIYNIIRTRSGTANVY